MPRAISTPTIVVNNIVLPIVPNSAVYTEGQGEQNYRAQSAGGGSVQGVYSDNAESKFSTFKCSVFNTAENINFLRAIKANGNNNAITITDTGFSRSITQAALTNNYEVNLGADTTVDIEFSGLPAV